MPEYILVCKQCKEKFYHRTYHRARPKGKKLYCDYCLIKRRNTYNQRRRDELSMQRNRKQS